MLIIKENKDSNDNGVSTTQSDLLAQHLAEHVRNTHSTPWESK